MTDVAHALLLTIALAVGGLGALRLVGRLTLPLAERVVGAGVVLASAIVLTAFAAAQLGVADMPVVLALPLLLAGAGAAWRYGSSGSRAQLRIWAHGSSPLTIGVAVGVAALVLAWIGWGLSAPFLDHDAVVYHLALPIHWLQGGHPGTGGAISDSIPYEAYPLANELLTTWLLGVAHGWAWATIQPIINVVALAGLTWVLMLRLDVPRWARVLGVATLVVSPLTLVETAGPLEDLTALVWLVAGAVLALEAREDRRVLGLVLLACALAVATKVAAAPAGLAIAALAVWRMPGRQHGSLRWLLVPGLFAVGIGAFMPLISLVDHGAPLWPFVILPGADPLPPVVETMSVRFAEHPGHMVSTYWSDYIRVFGLLWFIPLIALAVTAIASIRDRSVIIVTVGILGGIIVWTLAPGSGFEAATSTMTAVSARALLPTIFAAVFALSVIAGRGGRSARLSAAVLVAAIGVGVWALVQPEWGAPWRPSLTTLALVFAAAAAVGTLAARLARTARARVRFAAGTAVALPLALFVATAYGSHDYLDRVRGCCGFSVVAGALHDDEAFATDDARVYVVGPLIATLAGDRFERTIVHMPARTSCRRLRAANTDGWIVASTGRADRVRACLGPGRIAGLSPGAAVWEPSAAD